MTNRTTHIFVRTLALVSFALSVIANDPARAEDLYVAASASSNGNGTAAHPYWRITDAIIRARSDRQNGLVEPITIHVSPGTYMGSYSVTSQKTQLELLPIVLNIPNLALVGATALATDAGGLPTGVVGTQQTLLSTTDGSYGFGQALLMITRTTDGWGGNNVSVTGFVIDHPSGGGNALVVDHVSGFALQGNLITHGFSGLWTRLSSGVLTGNLFTGNQGPGAYINGGNIGYPANVAAQANRLSNNREVGCSINANVEDISLDLGNNKLTALPLDLTGSDADLPTGASITVSGNDISNNGFIGIRMGFVPVFVQSGRKQGLPGMPILTATISGNTINGNENYGLDVEGEGYNQRQNPHGTWSGTLVGSFAGNQVLGNGRQAACFTFTNVSASLSDNYALTNFLQQAVYNVTDPEGELTGFDYDNPISDPIDGTLLNNTLIINGTVFLNGTKITPLL